MQAEPKPQPHQPSSQYLITVEQLKNSHSTTSPGNRMNHITAYYNEQIFIIGGTSASNSNQDQHYRIVYWYSLENRQWIKKQFYNLIRSEDKERDNRDRDRERDRDRQREKQDQKMYHNNVHTRSSMAACQKEHRVYIFGGTNHRNECNDELQIFDMKRYQWESPKNQYAPAPRQSAYLVPYLDNYLLLYGGINLQQMQIYQHFHCYNIQTGVWKTVQEGNYREILRPRYQTSMCKIDDKIYVFGGQYRNFEGNHQYLSDFYQLTISLNKIDNISASNHINKNIVNTNSVQIKIDAQYIWNYNSNSVVNEKEKSKSQIVEEQKEKYKDEQQNKQKQQMMDIEDDQAKEEQEQKSKQKSNKQSPDKQKIKQANLAVNTRRRNPRIGKNLIQFVTQNLQANLVISQNNQINNRALSQNSRKNSRGSINNTNLNNNTNMNVPFQTSMTCSDRKYPQPKSGHKLLPINKQYLVLIGGGNSEQSSISNAWVYSIKNKMWRKIQFDSSIPKTLGIDCCLAQLDKLEDQSNRQRERQRERYRDRENEQRDREKQKEKEKQTERERQRQQKDKEGQANSKRQTRRDREKQRQKQKVYREQKPIRLYRIRERDLDSSDLHSNYNIIYIYGGLNCYDSVRCDLYRLKFDPQNRQQQAQEQIDTNQNKRQLQAKTAKTLQSLFYLQPKKQCNYCEYPRQLIYLNKQVIQSFTSMINFPFNAFGLLLQNSYHHSATQFSVLYRNEVYQTSLSTLVNLSTPPNMFIPKVDANFANIQNHKFPNKNLPVINTQPFLHILENNNLKNIQYCDLKSTMGNFEYLLHFTYHNIEKKVKLALQKQHQLRELGVYLKIAALRLGSQFIYITKGKHNERRIFSFLLTQPPKSGNPDEQHTQHYQFCTYLYDIYGKRIVEQPEIQSYRLHHQAHAHHLNALFSTKVSYFSNYSHDRINRKFGKYLEDIFIRYSPQSEYNHLLIFNLKQINKKINQTTFELIPIIESGDIHFSPYRRLMTSHSAMISQSIDASLRTYLSSYFLKGESPQMSIFINNKEKIINSLMCLEAFDTMTKNKQVFEIDNCLVNIEIKLMELYFNPNLKITTGNFHNGILFYHKGRLVARHQCPLGELYKKVSQRRSNYFNLFGVLQVPQAIRPNIFRTDFIYNVMMEKLRSRLKFMQKKLIIEFENQAENQVNFQNMKGGSSSMEKVMKLNKKGSLMKQKERDKDKQKQKQKKQKQQRHRQKKQDVQFNPNKRY